MQQPCDFETIEREERPQAKRIAEYFLRTLSLNAFPPKTRIIDVGCGPGLYVDELRKFMFDAHGVDSDERVPVGEHFHQLDVVSSVLRGGAEWFDQFDVALSLEAGGRVREEDSASYARFVQSTDVHTLFFSSPALGQGGVNCQSKTYWIRHFHAAGFYYDHDETEAWLKFMRDGYHMGWLTQNGMVFRRY